MRPGPHVARAHRAGTGQPVRTRLRVGPKDEPIVIDPAGTSAFAVGVDGEWRPPTGDRVDGDLALRAAEPDRAERERHRRLRGERRKLEPMERWPEVVLAGDAAAILAAVGSRSSSRANRASDALRAWGSVSR